MPQPVPQDLIRVHLNFTTGNEEIAVSTFHLRLKHEAGAPTNWPQMTQDCADKVADKWKSNVGNQPNPGLFPANVRLRDVATYHLDAATGHALDKGTSPATGARAWVGTGSKSLPLECATAVSLFGYAKGQFQPQLARRRGRMYLPALDVSAMDDATPATGGRLQAGVHNVLTQAMGAFFNDVHGMSVGQDPLNIGQSWDLVVVSRAGNFATVVNRVSVGDVVDVQRRRRNKQREFYRDVPITE